MYAKYLDNDAEDLRMNSAAKIAINEYIIHHLKKINDDIREAHNNKQTHIKYDMEYIFDVPQMSNADSQTFIFSSIIEALQEKSYKVKFKYNDKICMFIITWTSEKDVLEHRYRLKLINKAR